MASSLRADAAKLRQLRTGRAWTQQDLADRASLSRRTVEKAESGVPLFPRTLARLAEPFRLAVRDLVHPEDLRLLGPEESPAGGDAGRPSGGGGRAAGPGLPDLRAFLPDGAAGPRRAELLSELIMLDMRARWELGERVLLEAYVAGYPELLDPAGRGHVLELLGEEYAVRAAHGERPPLGEYAARFPGVIPAGFPGWDA